MRASHMTAMAASIVALCVAAPVLLNYAGHPVNETFSAVNNALSGGAGGGGVRPVPPEPQPEVRAPVRREAAVVAPAKVQDQPSATPPPAAPSTPPATTVPGMTLVSPSAAPPAPPTPAGAPRPRQAQEAQRRDESARLAELQRQLQGGSRAFSMKERADGIGAASTAAPDRVIVLPADHGRDRFEAKETNPVKQVAQEPVSTFSVDVDTASYSFVRRALNAGRLPPRDAVRVEEMINYFPYDYARPDSAETPFRLSVQVMPSPWNAGNQLIHIGLKGYDLKSAERPRANLVLLVDVSGSMAPADRLPLLKNAFRMLIDHLRPDDTIAIVTYAAGSDIRLQPTRVADKARIIAAIDSLNASGSTHGAAGINDAYRVAEANFDRAAVNRVILATDGDWNVGITNREELKGFVERKRQTGIYLSILGVGMGNHNDALMQALAQNGNGAAAYIDTLGEARKVLVQEASSTLFPIARDVKIQLELNPARVSEYRLIGYETRMLRREDFNNDRVDAGDVGSGHSVTAIYEITPVGAPRLAEELRYQPAPSPARGATPAGSRPPHAEDPKATELGFLKLRYKLPKDEASRLMELAIGPAQVHRTIAEAPAETRFSVAVAAFGQLLRGAPHVQGLSWDDVIALANGAKGEDPFGYRAEMVNLVRLAKTVGASVGPPQ